MAYDSDAARGICGSITAILHGTANLTSAELAAAVGTSKATRKTGSRFMKVMQMHRDAVDEIDDGGPLDLKEAAREVWDRVLAEGRPWASAMLKPRF